MTSLMRLASAVVPLLFASGACTARPAAEPPIRAPHASTSPAPAIARRAYVGGTVIPAPDASPIEDGVVLVEGDHIAAVGRRGEVAVPSDARVVDCRGTTVVAAFWNAHVHLMGPTFAGAAHAPAARLEDGMRAMLTRWGFAHAFDTGSRLEDTVALRDRVARGEIVGPAIRTTGTAFVAPGGQPVYLPFRLPELATPDAARAAATAMLDQGADGIKLMTASVVAHPPPPVMALEVVRAVADTAHARGALVFAHPSNRAGVLVARDGGVDILAHTAPDGGRWSPEDAAALVKANVSLVPTLSLWRREIEKDDPAVAARFEDVAVDQVRAFAAAGGTLLFGTDVGYRPEFDTTPEHALLARAGLSFAQRLAMLTTAPAARFHDEHTGRLTPALDADLVVLDGDPRVDPAAFARVRCTVRRGVTLFESTRGACSQ